MTVNAGYIDRSIRLAVAAGLFSLFFFATGPLRYAGLFGLMPLFTGLLGWCPLYSLLGVRTCPVR